LLYGDFALDNPGPDVTFADISDYPPDEVVPWLDRADVDESTLTPHQLEWRRDGVVTLRGFIPDELTEPYIKVRAAETNPAAWMTPSSYMHILEMRDLALYPPMMAVMKSLLGEALILQMCLTAWVSSERDWHQDDYLNPHFVNSWYTAVWIALGDIHPDSGPFEYIPGSHRWPLMRGEKVRRFLTEEELARRSPETGVNHWPRFAERFTTPAVAAEIAARGGEVVPFLGKKGDVLIWHSRLMHRGSLPKIPWMERRTLIAHYSAAAKRPDMIPARDQNGELYAVFDQQLVG